MSFSMKFFQRCMCNIHAFFRKTHFFSLGKIVVKYFLYLVKTTWYSRKEPAIIKISM